ncbi:MAG: electron transfer flavoprotein subunit alpha/FixB family protein [Myxococcaceae bacterium]
MPNVLIFVEQQPDGRLRKASLNAISAGKMLADIISGQMHLALLGKNVDSLVNEVKGFGAVAVHTVSHAALEPFTAESFAPALAGLAKSISAEYVGAASTAVGKDMMPRVAARLSAAMASDVMAIEGSGADIRFARPMWAGNVMAEVRLKTPIRAFTVRATDFPAPVSVSASAEVKKFEPVLDGAAGKTRLVEFKEVKSARPELTEARVVISGGRGTKGDFKEIEALADELGAAVGASRAVCDAGWVPNDLQVGQTGKVVAPQLYIAAGISGAIQHLAGMKGSKTIVAINKDPEAPIFQVADYGIVGDLFQVLPALRQAIKTAKG